jgi:hypothetical protein
LELVVDNNMLYLLYCMIFCEPFTTSPVTIDKGLPNEFLTSS